MVYNNMLAFVYGMACTHHGLPIMTFFINKKKKTDIESLHSLAIGILENALFSI